LIKLKYFFICLTIILSQTLHAAPEPSSSEPETRACVNPSRQNSPLRWAVALNYYTMGGEGLFLDRDQDLAAKYRPLDIMPRMQHGIYKAPDSGALVATGIRTDTLEMQVFFPQSGENAAWNAKAVSRLYDFSPLEQAVLTSMRKVPSLSIKVQGVGVGGALANQFASKLLHKGLKAHRLQLLIVDTPQKLLTTAMVSGASRGNSRDIAYTAAFCTPALGDGTL